VTPVPGPGVLSGDQRPRRPRHVRAAARPRARGTGRRAVGRDRQPPSPDGRRRRRARRHRRAVGLLAVALTGLDGVLSAAGRPAGWLIAGGLLLLAAWIVLCAGSGAALLDGTGRSLLRGVAYAEMVLVAALLVTATAGVLPNPTSLPVPALGLLLLAVPVGKLLLVGAPSAARWMAQGPRTRVRRPDPVQAHRLLATLTLGVIGASLCAVAILTPVQDGGAADPASAVFTQP
jgi:hypothetical protein